MGLNLVELRATKGGEVAAFRRFFRLWAFLTCWAVDWRAEERKGARGSKNGVLGRMESDREVQDGCFRLYIAAHGACGGCLAGCSSTVAHNGV